MSKSRTLLTDIHINICETLILTVGPGLWELKSSIEWRYATFGVKGLIFNYHRNISIVGEIGEAKVAESVIRFTQWHIPFPGGVLI